VKTFSAFYGVWLFISVSSRIRTILSRLPISLFPYNPLCYPTTNPSYSFLSMYAIYLFLFSRDYNLPPGYEFSVTLVPWFLQVYIFSSIFLTKFLYAFIIALMCVTLNLIVIRPQETGYNAAAPSTCSSKGKANLNASVSAPSAYRQIWHFACKQFNCAMATYFCFLTLNSGYWRHCRN
jgi:hypothetical protein